MNNLIHTSVTGRIVFTPGQQQAKAIVLTWAPEIPSPSIFTQLMNALTNYLKSIQ